MSATVQKLRTEFAAPVQKDAEIVVLYPAARPSNEEIRQRQYEAQKAMLEANLASGAFVEAVFTPEMLAVQHQPVREVNQTYAEQASMQGEKGWAFKI